MRPPGRSGRRADAANARTVAAPRTAAGGGPVQARFEVSAHAVGTLRPHPGAMPVEGIDGMQGGHPFTGKALPPFLAAGGVRGPLSARLPRGAQLPSLSRRVAVVLLALHASAWIGCRNVCTYGAGLLNFFFCSLG